MGSVEICHSILCWSRSGLKQADSTSYMLVLVY